MSLFQCIFSPVACLEQLKNSNRTIIVEQHKKVAPEATKTGRMRSFARYRAEGVAQANIVRETITEDEMQEQVL